MTKVIDISTGAPALLGKDNLKVNQDIVHVVSVLMDRALKGEITSIAFAYLMAGNSKASYSNFVYGEDRGDATRLPTTIACLHLDLLDYLRGGAVCDPDEPEKPK